MQQVGTASHNAYESIYWRLWREARAQTIMTRGEWADVTSHDLIERWLDRARRKNRYSINTLRIYRAALIYWLPVKQPPDWEGAVKILMASTPESVDEAKEGADDLGGFTLDGPMGRRRQSQRMIPEEDFGPLVSALEWQPKDEEDAGASVWRSRAALALKAGVATGCRPVEWLGASWVDHEAGILRIYSAKQKTREAWNNIPALTFFDSDDELAHAEDKERWKEIDPHVRHREFSRKIIFLRALGVSELIIDELIALKQGDTNVSVFRDVVVEDEMRVIVGAHMQEIAQFMGEKIDLFKRKNPAAIDIPVIEIYSDKYMRYVRTAIWRTCRTTFTDGRLYSLADARSTFAANRKALAGLKAAALDMGHAWPQTTRDFYAPARRAWSRYANVAPRMMELARDAQRMSGMPASSKPVFAGDKASGSWN
jgi:hypothetical protein